MYEIYYLSRISESTVFEMIKTDYPKMELEEAKSVCQELNQDAQESDDSDRWIVIKSQ